MPPLSCRSFHQAVNFLHLRSRCPSLRVRPVSNAKRRGFGPFRGMKRIDTPLSQVRMKTALLSPHPEDSILEDALTHSLYYVLTDQHREEFAPVRCNEQTVTRLVRYFEDIVTENKLSALVIEGRCLKGNATRETQRLAT